MPLFPIDASDRKPVGSTRETVSAVGIGTWAIRDSSRMIEALVYAFTHGIDNVDTAEMYGSGSAERIVGEALKQVGRDNVFVTTKLLPYRFRSEDLAVKAAKASLNRLGVNYVDLILIHWPDDLASIGEQVKSLEALAERGLTRYIGVSNFDARLLEEALQHARKYDIVVDQIHYSVLHRYPETELLPLAIRKKILVQAYTPIERGRVADIDLLVKIAERYGKSPVQVALNYLISRPMVVAIPKSERVERVKEFIGAMGWRLAASDLEIIERSL
ncbi:MAG: aldo/keto reductase [Desulfurococcales archaeon]|nr:aldo/keto reductase [Desulfurococcales archaeon]